MASSHCFALRHWRAFIRHIDCIVPLSSITNFSCFSLGRCYCFGFLTNILLTTLVEGTIAILANQGVAHTLRINRNGNKAFVIAYAVANLQHSQLAHREEQPPLETYSTTILVPPSPLPHHLCRLAFPSCPNHPFFRK